jgi:ABC-2 type transport system permease protein
VKCPDPLRRMLAVARAEWIHNVRDTRSLAIIISLPIFLLLLYGFAIDFELEELEFAVQDWDRSEQSGDLIKSMVASNYFTLNALVTDGEEIDRMIASGEIRLGLVIRPGFGAEIAAGRTGRVQAVIDGSDSTTAGVALGYLEAIMREYQVDLTREWVRRQGVPASMAGAPLEVETRSLYNPELKTVVFIVPGLIAIIMTMLAALLTSGCIVRERETGSFEGLAASPIAPVEIIIGKLLPYGVIATGDVILCIITGWLIFGVFPLGDKPALLITSGIYLVASLAIGLAISSVTRSHQVATLIAFLATMLPSMLLTGFVFPIRSMPTALQYISQVIPATHFLTIIRGIYLKGTGLGLYIPETIALTVISLALVALAAKTFSKSLE